MRQVTDELTGRRPLRKANVRARRYRGRLYLASADKAYELNEAAEYVFRQIDGSTSIDEIATRLAAKYQYAVADAVADTVELLVQLASRQVIEQFEDQAVADSSAHS